jgi:hypothetical protein
MKESKFLALDRASLDESSFHHSKSMPNILAYRLYAADTSQVSEDLLRKMWEFRLSIISLRPEITQETDWVAFRSYFQPGVEVITAKNRAGELQGIFGWSFRIVHDDQETHVVVDAEYGFVHAAARGSIIVPAAIFRTWSKAAIAGRSRIIYVLGSGYPSSVLAFNRLSDRLVSLNDADVLPWERQVIAEHCAKNDCIDLERGILRMRTVPLEKRRIPRSESNRKKLAWYEDQIPNWEDGFGLVYLVRIDPLAIVRSWIQGLK